MQHIPRGIPRILLYEVEGVEKYSGYVFGKYLRTDA